MEVTSCACRGAWSLLFHLQFFRISLQVSERRQGLVSFDDLVAGDLEAVFLRIGLEREK